MKQSISPHKLRHFLFTWLKKQGIEDALIQPYSGHESRQSLEIYSKLSIGDAQKSYENVIHSAKVSSLKSVETYRDARSVPPGLIGIWKIQTLYTAYAGKYHL